MVGAGEGDGCAGKSRSVAVFDDADWATLRPVAGGFAGPGWGPASGVAFVTGVSGGAEIFRSDVSVPQRERCLVCDFIRSHRHSRGH